MDKRRKWWCSDERTFGDVGEGAGYVMASENETETEWGIAPDWKFEGTIEELKQECKRRGYRKLTAAWGEGAGAEETYNL